MSDSRTTSKYNFLDSLTYHSTSDIDFPAKTRRQSFAIDSKENIYFIEKASASGEYGQIRIAIDSESKKPAFVVKELFNFNEKAKEMAIRENKQWRKIWPFSGFQIDKNKIRFFMPHLGQPLSKVLPLITDDKLIIKLAIAAIDELELWHKQGLIHGDLHHNNLLVDGDRINLCDAGFSADFNEPFLIEWDATCIQIAPEVKKHPVAHPTQDVYSMGQLLQPYYGFGKQLTEIKSPLAVFTTEIAFALTRLKPEQRISLKEARTQLNRVLDLYDFLYICNYFDPTSIKEELKTLVTQNICPNEIILCLAIQMHSVPASEYLLDEKLNVDFLYNNETLLMLALRKSHTSRDGKYICNKLIDKLKAVRKLEQILEKSYDCITTLLPYKQSIYFEEFKKFPTLIGFLVEKKIKNWSFFKESFKEWFNKCIDENDFITLRYYMTEAPSSINTSALERDLCFKWFNKCIETNNIIAMDYLLKIGLPLIFFNYNRQKNHKPIPICRAAALGHFELVTLLEEYGAFKDLNFGQSMRDGLDFLEKTDLETLLADTTFRAKMTIYNIVSSGLQRLAIEDNKKLHEEISYILKRAPIDFFEGMNIIQDHNLSYTDTKSIKLLFQHPYFMEQAEQWANTVLNELFKEEDYQNFDVYFKVCKELTDLSEKLGEQLKKALSLHLNHYLQEKNLKYINQIKKLFPDIYQEWFKQISQESFNDALKNKWFDGIHFMLNEDKSSTFDISYIHNYIKIGEYKTIAKIMQYSPDRFPSKILLPRILQCIYWGNLDELKKIEKALPDAFKHCLSIQNTFKNKISDILEEKASGKNLTLFSDRTFIKTQFEGFSIGQVWQDKSLRTTRPARYKDIALWLKITFNPPVTVVKLKAR